MFSVFRSFVRGKFVYNSVKLSINDGIWLNVV